MKHRTPTHSRLKSACCKTIVTQHQSFAPRRASHMLAHNRQLCAIAAVGLFAGVAAAGNHSAVVAFDQGWEGWNGTGSQLSASGGNPGAHIHTEFVNFGTEYWTDENPDFLGDWTQYESVTLSIDVKVHEINFYGTPVSRNLILDLRSFTLSDDYYPWTSAWYNLGSIEGGMDWTTFSVTIDPNSPVMPEGWDGTGAEHPTTYEPMLPEHLTWADILASIEEVNFGTYEPGWFYSLNTYFHLRVDNIRIEATPKAPGVPGDLNGDGVVGVADLLILLANWGPCKDASNCPADLNGDAGVGVADLLILLGNWG